MNSRDFVYWLQGFLEIGKPEVLTKEQLEMVQKHLNLVFVHEIDPTFGDKKKQDLLNKIHEFKPPKKILNDNLSDPKNPVYRC